MSHESVVAFQKTCGQDFDSDILMWRVMIVGNMLLKEQQSSCEQLNICTHNSESDTESNESNDSDQDSDDSDTECDSIEDDDSEYASTCSCSDDECDGFELSECHTVSVDTRDVSC